MKQFALGLLLAVTITSPAFSSGTIVGQPGRCDSLARAYTGRTGQQVPCNNFCQDPVTRQQVQCFVHNYDENNQYFEPGIWCRCNSSGQQPGFNAPGQIGIGFPGTGAPGTGTPGAGTPAAREGGAECADAIRNNNLQLRGGNIADGALFGGCLLNNRCNMGQCSRVELPNSRGERISCHRCQ